MTERALSFTCEGQQLCGVLHEPQVPSSRGVVMLVGGPQYRVGSHRQFVLTARALAAEGISVLRFDHRGVGDSDGETRSFEALGDDVASAIVTLMTEVSQVKTVVIWGLCDAASAAALYAPNDSAVSGIVLLNPWVRDDKTIARTYLRHYYPNRLVSPGLWSKVLGGKFEFRRSLHSFFETAIAAIKGRRDPADGLHHSAEEETESLPLQERMRRGLDGFRGEILIILSGEDLTAKEFTDVSSSAPWRSTLLDRRVTQHVLPNADHTFRVRAELDHAAKLVSQWMLSK